MKQTVEIQVSGPDRDEGPRPSVYPQVAGYGYETGAVQGWFELFVEEYETRCSRPISRIRQRGQFCTWHPSYRSLCFLDAGSVKRAARALANGQDLTYTNYRNDSTVVDMPAWTVVMAIAAFAYLVFQATH